MAQSLAVPLRDAIDRAMPRLETITEAKAASARVGWTRKEELGHLLDSAANNHQRFVRGGLDGHYTGPGYLGDAWVAIHGYAELPWTFLVQFWKSYNSLLCEVIARIPDSSLGGECAIGDGDAETLQFVIEDYVKHLQHHIDRILSV